jgi:hypothetical protein
MKLSTVFSRENQNRATWATFILAFLINILFIIFYDAVDGDKKVNNAQALTVITVLNALQSAVACFVLILSLAVRSPVIYQSLADAGHNRFYTVLYTATDAMTMYFSIYLVLSFFGLLLADYYLPFLLLDIVAKNATTRDILNAVVIPRKQLMMTVVLAVFVNYIYAYFYVSFWVLCLFFLFLGVNYSLRCFACLVLAFPL